MKPCYVEGTVLPVFVIDRTVPESHIEQVIFENSVVSVSLVARLFLFFTICFSGCAEVVCFLFIPYINKSLQKRIILFCYAGLLKITK